MKSTVLLLCLMAEAIFGSPLYTVLIPYIHQSPVRQMLPVEPVVVELETAYECTKEGSFADPDSCDSYYVCNTTPEGGLKVNFCMQRVFERFFYLLGSHYKLSPWTGVQYQKEHL